jgi:hypothetical protein
LKACISNEEPSKELLVSRHIQSIEADHQPSRPRLRVVVDEFKVTGLDGRQHQCLIFDPQGITFTKVRRKFRDYFTKTLLQHTLLMVLLGLDVLHQMGIVHTGM